MKFGDENEDKSERVTVTDGRYGHRIISRAKLMRWLLFALLVVMLVGGTMVLSTQYYLGTLQELAQSDPESAMQRASWLLGVVLTFTLISVLAIGGFVIWYGYRTLRNACFPPPGAWVMEGQFVYKGPRARRLGWTQIVLGAVMPLVVLVLTLRVWVLLYPT